MTRSFRPHWLTRPRPRRVDPGVTSLGFTCYRVDRDRAPFESLFPRITMALLVRPSAAAWMDS